MGGIIVRVKVIVKIQLRLTVFANQEGGVLRDAIGLLEGLAEKQIGKGAFLAPLFMLEAQGFFASPFRKGSNSRLKFFRSDGGKIVSHIKFIIFLHSSCSSWL